MTPSRYMSILVAAALLAFSTNQSSAQLSTFRVTNMTSVAVDAYLADSALPIISNLQSKGSSSAMLGLVAQVLLRVTAAQDSSLTLFTGSVLTSLTQSLNFVLVNRDSSGADTISLFSPNTNTIELGRSQLRFVNTFSSALNFRITDADGQVSTLANVGVGAVADFSTVSDGIARIDVMLSATGAVIFSARDTLADRGRQTIFATIEMADSLGLRALDELDASAQASLRLLARIAGGDSTARRRLRIVNLFDDTTGLSVSLNGTVRGSLMFNEASELLEVADSLSSNFAVGLSLIGGIGGPLFNGVFDLSNQDSATTLIAVRGGLGAAQTITLRRARDFSTLIGDSGALRVVNASASGAFDVRIISGGDTTVATGLGFAASSAFSYFKSGRFTIDVRAAGSATFDHLFEGELSAQSVLTLVITGEVNDSASFGLSVVNELDLAAQRPLIRLRRLFENGRTARLRAVQLVADFAARLDIRIEDSTVIRNLGYREASNVVEVNVTGEVGTRVGLTLNGDTTSLVEGVLNLGGTVSDSAAFTTVFAIGSVQGVTARIVPLETRSSDAAMNGRAMVRVVNAVAADASPGTGGRYDLLFDFSGGGTLNLDNIGFGQSTAYNAAAAGNFTLHIMRDNDTTTMQSVKGNLAANTTFTVILNGASTGSNGRVVRALANSAAPVIDALLLVDMVGSQPANAAGPIPILGQVSSVDGVEIASGLRVVPNPVRDVASLRYGLGITQRVTVTLLDSKGAIAATFDVGAQAPGTYEVNLGLSRLPVGTYTAVLFDQRGDRLGSTRLVISR